MTTFVLCLLSAAVALAVGYTWGERNKGRECARWVQDERRERVAADRAARQAEARERAAKQRIGEQVRAERLARMFGTRD